MLCGLCLFAACSDDNDSNPILGEPSEFVLNAPAVENAALDLGQSSKITLTCSQPDYGFPAATTYNVYVATDANMSDATMIEINSKTTTLELDAALLASTLTDMMVQKGKVEEDFPMTIPVYFQAEAVMTATTGTSLENTRIKSNVVAINKVNLAFSLPPVTAPDALYVVGNFCEWNWDKSVQMVQVYDAPNIFWHMVYIDGAGIKFNTATAWDGGERGIAGITIDPASELGDEIQDSGDGNIASSKPGWYLMIVTASVEGRDINYSVMFNKPEVRLIGEAMGGWDEGMEGSLFEIPTTADGEFISPVLPALPGDDSGCVRMYCKVPGYDWWKSEFIVGLDGDKISYRGMGGDQDRVGCAEGERVYLSFKNDTGKIKE